MEFEDTEFPASYEDADRASLSAQRKYLVLFFVILLATLSGATCSWLSKLNDRYHPLTAYLGAVSVFVALVTTLLLRERKYENTWYMGRAIAESIKTRAWSFMMCASPYGRDKRTEEANAEFLRDLGRILKERGPLILTKKRTPDSKEITDAMSLVRKSTLDERIALYIRRRIVDQKTWYASKAAESSSKESKMFLGVICIQVLAVAVSFYAISQGYAPSRIIGVLAAFSSGSLAWLQVKKYQETAQAYSVTSLELSLIEGLGRAVKTEADFAKFVEESESAISREHTLWIARRTSK
jgi:hypothetical protein